MISLLTPGSLEEIIVHMSPSHMTHFLTRLLLSSHVENNCVAIQLVCVVFFFLLLDKSLYYQYYT